MAEGEEQEKDEVRFLRIGYKGNKYQQQSDEESDAYRSGVSHVLSLLD
jgi:hypothetical protein